jgi:ABC-type transporter Mla subunit MlaD
MYVHNLSAVGEQYLDFEPADDKPPYAEDGDTLHGSADSLPVDEGDLLVELNSFVDSVGQEEPADRRPRARDDVPRHRRALAAAARQRHDLHRRGVGSTRRRRGRCSTTA